MSEKKRYDTWTYASANSVTVPGDMTGTYWPGMKVALKQGTIKYFVIYSVIYSNPNTIITLNGLGIYTLTNDPITAHIDTLETYPKGFPTGFIYTTGKLSMRPFIEIGKIAQNNKPTIIQRGASSGYSLPIYNSDNEELFISEYIAGRWNGASNITLSIIGYIDTDEDVNDDFALQVSWINKSTSSGILPATTTDVTTVTNIETDRNVQYSIYKVDFAIDWDLNDPDIVASDYFAARIRRVAVGSGNVEMSGEFVITMIIITYDVDKVFKST